MPSTIRLHRVIKAPPDRLFRAFTDPRALVKWMAPHGFVAEVHSIEARTGGSYRMSFTNLGTGQGHTFGGKYLEVRPGELIRHTDAFDDPSLPGTMTVSVTFRKVTFGAPGPACTCTELGIVQEGIPDLIPAEMCYLGWQESLALLTALVEPEIP
ncbi:MAG: SRPBCC family protein [Phycisphaerales bacterium]|nr:SRPBCC family protein [Phycisphaerales bacterium]